VLTSFILRTCLSIYYLPASASLCPAPDGHSQLYNHEFLHVYIKKRIAIYWSVNSIIQGRACLLLCPPICQSLPRRLLSKSRLSPTQHAGQISHF
jgi:hypothetical protein